MADPQDPNAPVRLVDAQGNISTASRDWVQRQIADNVLEASGYRLAGEADIASHNQRVRQEAKPVIQRIAEAAITAEEAGRAATLDAATSIVRAPVQVGARLFGDKEDQETASNLEGRKVLENLEYIANEAIGREGGKAAKSYRERVQQRAEENPTAAFLGRAGGEIAGSLPTLGAGAGLGWAGRAGLAGLEGAGLGGSQAAEDAYLKNHELTAEQWWAGVGLGGVLGAGAELGLTGAGKAWRAFRSPTKEAALEIPTGAAYRKATPEALETITGRALGVDAEPGTGKTLRAIIQDKYVQAAGGLKGENADIVKAMGAQNWSAEARAARAEYLNAPKIIDDAIQEGRRHADDLITSTGAITEEVVQRQLKRSHVAANLSGIDDDLAVVSARNFSRRLREDVEGMLVNYGKEGKRQLDDLARHLKKYDTRVQTGDAADAYMALDEMRRAVAKRQTSLRRSAMASNLSASQEAMYEMADAMRDRYLRTADFLMDETTWGKQGLAQGDVNRAWVRYIQAKDTAFSSLATRQYQDSLTGHWVYAADDAKISSHIKNLGRSPEGSLKERNLREFIAATKQLNEAIGKNYELPAEKVAALSKMRDAVTGFEGHVNKAYATLKRVNQVDEMLSREAEGGVAKLASAFGGGLIGGLPGAALGAAVETVVRPAHTLVRLARVEAVRGQVEKRFGERLTKIISSESAKELPAKAGTRPALPTLPLSQAARAAGQTGAHLTSQEFIGKFGDERKAYKARVADIQTLATNPYAMNARLTQTIGPYAEVAPAFASHLTNKAAAAVMFLASKAAPADPLTPLSPQLEEIYSRVPDEKIRSFARYWQAVNKPESLFDELERGTLTHEHVEAVQAVYPQLYQELQFSAMKALGEAKKPVPYEARRQLDIMLNLGGAAEPSLTPGFQRVLANVAAIHAQQRSAQAQRSRPMSPKFSERYQTLGSSVEAA